MCKWCPWKHKNKSEANDKDNREFDNKIQRRNNIIGNDPNLNVGGI